MVHSLGVRLVAVDLFKESPVTVDNITCGWPDCQAVDYPQPALLTLVHNAIANARPCEKGERPLWSVVADIFAIGSTSAKTLCRAHGYDPDQVVGPMANPVRTPRCACVLPDCVGHMGWECELQSVVMIEDHPLCDPCVNNLAHRLASASRAEGADPRAAVDPPSALPTETDTRSRAALDELRQLRETATPSVDEYLDALRLEAAVVGPRSVRIVNFLDAAVRYVDALLASDARGAAADPTLPERQEAICPEQAVLGFAQE